MSTPHPYRWTILAVGVGAQAGLSAFQQGLPALGPALREEFALSLSQVGVVFAAVSWGIMVPLMGWGKLADRFGERIVITCGLTGGSLALVAAAEATGYEQLLVLLALAGALAGSAFSTGRAIVGWFDRTERGMALGVRQMAIPLAGAVGAVTLPQLVAAGGLPAALHGLAAASALGAVAAAIWMRDPPPPPPNQAVIERPPPTRDGRVWRVAVGSALIVCAQVSLLSFVVLFLHDERGVEAGVAAAALGAIQLGGAAARFFAGRYSDKVGRRIAPLRRLGIASAGAILATAALTAAPLIVLAPVLWCAGVLAMSWAGLAFAATAELSGLANAGTSMGLVQTVMRSMSAGAAIVFATFVGATSWGLAFAALAALPVAGWWILRPLVAEEEERIAAREQRTAAAATA